MNNENVIIIGNVAIGVDELVNSHVAGKICGMSSRTIRDLGVKRSIPIYKIGVRSNRFLVRDLLEWCEDKRIDTTSQ